MTAETETVKGTDNPRARDTDRAEAVTEQRRRRRTDLEAENADPSLVRFGVPDTILDLEKYVYRSVEDRGNRLNNLTVRDDWDFVTTDGSTTRKANGAGVLRYRSGTIDGQPVYTYLLRKLREFAEEDRRAKEARNAERTKLRLTKKPDDAPEEAYMPGKA